MELFKPELVLIREDDGTYTLHSVTLTPTSCYVSAGVRKGVPPGWASIPEAVPYQLDIRHVGEICLPVITPVQHQVLNIVLGQGKDAVVAFAVLEGKVVGVNSVRHSAAHGAPVLGRIGGAETATFLAADVPVRCLSLSKAGTIVRESCPRPVTSIDQQLNEVGVTDPNTAQIFVENVRARVTQEGCHIKVAQIPSDPANTIKEVRDAVFGTAE